MVEELLGGYILLWVLLLVVLPLGTITVVIVRALRGGTALAPRCKRGRHTYAGVFGCTGRWAGRRCSCGCHRALP